MASVLVRCHVLGGVSLQEGAEWRGKLRLLQRERGRPQTALETGSSTSSGFLEEGMNSSPHAN